jgi:death-on-curing protein
MSGDPIFLSEEVVCRLHTRALEQHGGMDGLRDSEILASALHQPEVAWHNARADLFSLAAAYAYHIAQNQPFIDGNKRTAMLAALTFLEINGVNTSSCTDDSIYNALIAIAEKRLDKAGLAAVFSSQLSP